MRAIDIIELDLGWYFADEDWSVLYGPYENEKVVNEAVKCMEYWGEYVHTYKHVIMPPTCEQR